MKRGNTHRYYFIAFASFHYTAIDGNFSYKQQTTYPYINKYNIITYNIPTLKFLLTKTLESNCKFSTN